MGNGKMHHKIREEQLHVARKGAEDGNLLLFII